MARFEFKMPDVGEGLADVEVVAWFVKVGDLVEENQPIADVETDKAIVTMPAPATGRVIELAAKEGERVKVGAFLLAIETESEEPKMRGGEEARTQNEDDGPNLPTFQPPTPNPQPPLSPRPRCCSRFVALYRTPVHRNSQLGGNTAGRY
jgi:2-oxoisovalerate dehydrogenase E2 component (dihydrolipoyl transacylase)